MQPIQRKYRNILSKCHRSDQGKQKSQLQRQRDCTIFPSSMCVMEYFSARIDSILCQPNQSGQSVWPIGFTHLSSKNKCSDWNLNESIENRSYMIFRYSNTPSYQKSPLHICLLSLGLCRRYKHHCCIFYLRRIVHPWCIFSC